MVRAPERVAGWEGTSYPEIVDLQTNRHGGSVMGRPGAARSKPAPRDCRAPRCGTPVETAAQKNPNRHHPTRLVGTLQCRGGDDEPPTSTMKLRRDLIVAGLACLASCGGSTDPRASVPDGLDRSGETLAPEGTLFIPRLAKQSSLDPALPTMLTAFQLQNDNPVAASVTIEYHDESGATVATGEATIEAGSSHNVFPMLSGDGLEPPDFPTFRGSAVVRSNVELFAMVNATSAEGEHSYVASTRGINRLAARVGLPLIMCQNSGFHTQVTVQNTTDEATTVRL